MTFPASFRRPLLPAVLLLPAIAALLLTGCASYHLGSVGGKNLQGVNSVYVPIVKNETLEPSIDVSTTAEIIRTFDQDGTLKTNQSPEADSQLDVTLISVGRDALTMERLDSQAGNQFQVTLTARITFMNRRLGKKICDNVTVSGSNTYIVQGDQVEAERQAMPMAEEDLAKHIVSLVVEGW